MLLNLSVHTKQWEKKPETKAAESCDRRPQKLNSMYRKEQELVFNTVLVDHARSVVNAALTEQAVLHNATGAEHEENGNTKRRKKEDTKRKEIQKVDTRKQRGNRKKKKDTKNKNTKKIRRTEKAIRTGKHEKRQKKKKEKETREGKYKTKRTRRKNEFEEISSQGTQ